jgi:hypothetical protein
MFKQVLCGIGGAYAGAYLYLFSLKKNGFLQLSEYNIKMLTYVMAGTTSSLILYNYSSMITQLRPFKQIM